MPYNDSDGLIHRIKICSGGSMTQIKIISNPYQTQIAYQLYDDADHEWKDILANSEYSGKLRAERLVRGFFPFVVKDIVDDIIVEFYDGKNGIRLYFEGTPDEYAELRSVCSAADVQKVIDLQPIGRTLNNAYEILPGIVEIFDQHVRPIVEASITDESAKRQSIEDDLARYTDASNEVIPICVVGNYSAGKSTFINSLIGHEILPSGDQAVTAKVYKIYQAKDADNAMIMFTYADESLTVHVYDDRFEIDQTESQAAVAEALETALSEIQDSGYTVRVNRALTVINDLANKEGSELGDLIEIHIPFNKGLWGSFAGRFVILDTPGSNAASHGDHREVLTKAMEGMSNGIPVYVTEYDSLDSTDNEELSNILKEMEGLDARFSMIVINKADCANLPRGGFSADEIKIILDESIPKCLYSGGIYFVSSIMGLGSKNDGRFLDYHCDAIFGLYQQWFTDATDRHYEELYTYNIMPDQIKPVTIAAAQEAIAGDSESALYVNSGLYSVEHAIQTFASKYASYNKCYQSHVFLCKVISHTDDELVRVTEIREQNKTTMEAKLERDKQEMIHAVENSASQEQRRYKTAYNAEMQALNERGKRAYTEEELRAYEAAFTHEQRETLDVAAKKEDLQKQTADIGYAVKKGWNKILNIKSGDAILGTLKDVGGSVLKEVKEAADSGSTLVSTSREANRAAAAELIQGINQNFCKQITQFEQDMEQAARDYWTNCSAQFREALASVVKNSTLSDEKKVEISEMISSYRRLELDAVENGDIFRVDEFDYLLNFGDLKLFKIDKLFLGRLASAYKERISELVDRVNQNVYKSYRSGFESWAENLVNMVRGNIVDYSPELKEQQQQIDAETALIHDLQIRRNRLQTYSEDISAKLNWTEA